MILGNAFADAAVSLPVVEGEDRGGRESWRLDVEVARVVGTRRRSLLMAGNAR